MYTRPSVFLSFASLDSVLICGWESVDAEGRLYALHYAILYIEHPRICVFKGGPGTHPPQILRDNGS